MRQRWVAVAVLAVVVASQLAAAGDWKSDLARKAVGRIAQEGIEEAVEDAFQDVAFDAALNTLGQGVGDTIHESIGSNAGDAIEAAITAANVASTLDEFNDAAEAARKVNKARKAIGKIR